MIEKEKHDLSDKHVSQEDTLSVQRVGRKLVSFESACVAVPAPSINADPDYLYQSWNTNESLDYDVDVACKMEANREE